MRDAFLARDIIFRPHAIMLLIVDVSIALLIPLVSCAPSASMVPTTPAIVTSCTGLSTLHVREFSFACAGKKLKLVAVAIVVTLKRGKWKGFARMISSPSRSFYPPNRSAANTEALP